MDDNNHNIFEVLGSPPSNKKMKTTSNTIVSTRRSNLAVMNTSNEPCSSSSPSNTNTSSSSSEPQRPKRRDRELQDLGFINPGPKNLVNVSSVPSRRLKTRQPSAQDKSSIVSSSSSKPLYNKAGRLVSDDTDRCDCNRLVCPGCFLPCASCHSPKCGLECRSLRTYTYVYRLFGTNKEIIQQ